MYSINYSENSIFIDNAVKQRKILLDEVVNSSDTYHVFSHGRSGELFINGKWLNAKQISEFLQPQILNTKCQIATLNIYGCEFAKGEKGKQAVAYLEKTLGVKVNASINITGKDGDWVLEVGNITIENLKQYQYNLQDGSASDPFTDLTQALTVSSAGVYHFDIGGQTFSSHVDANGYVLVAIDFGNGTGNLPQSTSLTTTARGILSPAVLATLTGAHELRLSYSGGALDAVSTSSELLSRVINNQTLHKGSGDDVLHNAWVGTGSNTLNNKSSYCASSAGVELHRNVFHTCGDASGFYWTPSTGNQRLDFNSNEIADSESFRLWLRAKDSDQDGINDNSDLDDDNDGILDTDEGYCEAEAVKDIVFVLDQSGSINTAEATDMVNGIKTFLTGDIGSGRDISFVVMEDDNVYGEEQPALIKVAMTGTSVPASITTYLDNWLAVANSPAVGRDYWASGFQGVIQHLGADLGPNYEVIVLTDGNSSSFTSTRTAAIPILNTGAHLFAIGPYDAASGATPTVGEFQAVMNATYGEPTQEVTDYETSEFDFVPDFSGLGTALSTQLGVALCKVQDTDNDGIADYLDLDSDGDGCPDAIEGAGSFEADDLEESSMPGGNTDGSADFTGTAGPVISNLGITVNSEGVPIVTSATTAAPQSIGSSQASGTITITEQPENASVCESNLPTTATFTAEATANPSSGLSWHWEMRAAGASVFTPISGATGTGTLASLTVNVTSTSQNLTAYHVVYTSTNMACPQYSNDAVLTVTESEALTISPRSFCVNDTPGQIQASPSGGTFSGDHITSSGLFDPQAAGVGSHTITYSYTSPEGCVSDPVTATISVSENPFISLATNPICVNADPEQLQVSPSGGTFSGPGVDANGLFTPSTAGVGTHTVYYEVTNSSGCSGRASTQLVVKGQPTVQISDTDTLCLNDAPVQLSAFSAGGTFSGTGVSETGLFTPSTAGVGSHTITYSVTKNGCTTEETTTIEVANSAQLVATPTTQTICSGASADIAITGNNGATVTWQSDLFGLSGTGTSISETLDNNGSSAYTVTFTIQAEQGNCTDEIEATVTVKPNPRVISSSKSLVYCDYETLSVTLTAAVSGTTINWTLLDSDNVVVNSGSGTNSLVVTQSNLDSGLYTLQYTGTLNGCTSETYNLQIIVN